MSEIDLRRGQPLSEPVMQLAGNASPFLILHSHDLCRKLAQRQGSFFNQ